ALRVDALHCEAGQILHVVPPQRPIRWLPVRARLRFGTPTADGCWRDCARGTLWCEAKIHNREWWAYGLWVKGSSPPRWVAWAGLEGGVLKLRARWGCFREALPLPSPLV